MLASALLLLVVACAGPPGPRPVVKTEDPADHLLRIASVWQQAATEEGLLEGDPKGIAHFRVISNIELTLPKDGKAIERIRRTEEFRTVHGSRFHCTTSGTLGALAHYERKGDEIRVVLETEGGNLPRSCAEPGFPVPTKEVPALRVVFALRSDQLVAIEPPSLRASFIPLR